MPRKRLIRPTRAEDVKLTRAAKADEDNPPLTNQMLSKMRPVREAHPDLPRRIRGPQKTPTKEQLSIRLSRDVVEYFRAGGPGWQSRIDRALREYVAAK